MVKIKGVGIEITRDFVKEKFSDRYDEWLEQLPEDTKEIFISKIDSDYWYSINPDFTLPVQRIIEFFYNNDVQRGATEIGQYSAEQTFKGMDRLLSKLLTSGQILKRIPGMISKYYQPCSIELTCQKRNKASLKISKLDDLTPATEYRLAAWIQRTLELANGFRVSFDIKKSIAIGDPHTEIDFIWN
jgi:hypothetical protein